ncbi:MAG: hypothetical protein ACRDCB_13130 [Clostridium sp.]
MKKIAFIGTLLLTLGIFVGCGNNNKELTDKTSEASVTVGDSDLNKEETSNKESEDEQNEKNKQKDKEEQQERDRQSKIEEQKEKEKKREKEEQERKEKELEEKKKRKISEKPKLNLTEEQIYKKFIACSNFSQATEIYNSFSEKYPHFWETNDYDEELDKIDRAYDRAIEYFSEKGLL